MHMDDKFSLKLSQEEGILLLTSARLLDKLVAGVTIHAKERDELIREIIDKLSLAISPELVTMSEELANAIVESVLGCDEQDDIELGGQDGEPEFVEVSSDSNSLAYPMYAIDGTLPVLKKAMEDKLAVSVRYYSFARESMDQLTLNPLSIMQENEIWRMVAYCHELAQPLIFRVDRIKEINKTSRKFETPRELRNCKSMTFGSYR